MLYTFDVRLIECSDPAVWRKIVVPDHFGFHRFHRVLQAAFGWSDSHMYEFAHPVSVKEPRIAESGSTEGIPFRDSRRYKLRDYFKKSNQQLIYTYDRESGWRHMITFESFTGEVAVRATCIDGGGKCPPEDIGGIPEFHSFKAAINNPAHQQYHNLRSWLGLSEIQVWNRHEFSVIRTRASVAKK